MYKNLSEKMSGDIAEFRNTVYDFYRESGRCLPWRDARDPYYILVSEVMLQQTPVARVHDKYLHFINAFPTVSALAGASLRSIFVVWQGLGYNRRASALQKCARMLMEVYGGRVPPETADLKKLPGIGKATASAISVFAFNRPVVFVETNIRTVFIHHFFPDGELVTDRELLPYVEAALDTENPRMWYSALMDYGVMLKKKFSNPGKKSAHYVRQSPFNGSDRQIRGQILACLSRHRSLPVSTLVATLNAEPRRIRKIIRQLEMEQFIGEKDGSYSMVGD